MIVALILGLVGFACGGFALVLGVALCVMASRADDEMWPEDRT